MNKGGGMNRKVDTRGNGNQIVKDKGEKKENGEGKYCKREVERCKRYVEGMTKAKEKGKVPKMKRKMMYKDGTEFR